uniref:NADH-ubiquinone oxidoreductase chain 2 n=2 Tax=Rena humilis TaxID=711330 RepID=Q6I7Y6_RENHU|nr:NADH dehydrogenase subunit 2 [Rena humilis]BAD24738.1 NADH dehydrogenase subunit 2 [Rena humilis]
MTTTSWTMMTLNITLGTLLAATSHHWMLAWTGLELNTLAMIPMIAKPHHPRATEAAIKYFLTQTTASLMILFAILTGASETGTWEINQMCNQTTSIILTTALPLKMGAAPFHFWLPEVLQGASTLTSLTILSWQKLAPLALMATNTNNLNQTTLLLMALLSILTGGALGINQTNLQKLMAYSSISHMGWIMAIIKPAPKIAAITLTIYIIMIIPIFNTMKTMNLKSIKNLNSTKPAQTTLTLNLLSLGGLPPTSGFIPKLLILNNMITNNLTPLATTMAILSLLSLYFYLRMTYFILMTNPPKTSTLTKKWRLPQHKNTMTTTLIMMLSTTLLPLTPILM